LFKTSFPCWFSPNLVELRESDIDFATDFDIFYRFPLPAMSTTKGKGGGSVWMPKSKKKLSIASFSQDEQLQIQRFLAEIRQNRSQPVPQTLNAVPQDPPQRKPLLQSTPSSSSSSNSMETSSQTPQDLQPPLKRRNTDQVSANTRQAPLRQSQPSPAREEKLPAALPNPTRDRTVIIDGVMNVNRKELESSFCQAVPWLFPKAFEIMRNGGMRIICNTPAEADRLLKRDGFSPNAFNGGTFNVHRPGATDPSRPISSQLERDQRTAVTARLPIYFTADEILQRLEPDYVESVRDIPPRDENRPPLRIIIFKTKAQRDDAIDNGLRWFHRRIKLRPFRPPVLPLFCRKCSRYGHTAVDCGSWHPTCAKCTDQHETATCDKKEQANYRCPNCPTGTNHSAKYRGCPAFKKAASAEAARRQTEIDRKIARTDQRRQQQFQQRSKAPAPIRPGLTFAAAAASNVQPPQSQQPESSQILNEIRELKQMFMSQNRRIEVIEEVLKDIQEDARYGQDYDMEAQMSNTSLSPLQHGPHSKV
jgi:hypothetical protein